MRPRVLLEERQLHFLLPAQLPDPQAVRILRTLKSRKFQTALRQGIRQTLGQSPALSLVRVRIG